MPDSRPVAHDHEADSPDKEQSKNDVDIGYEQEDSQKWHQKHAHAWSSKNKVDWHEKWAHETWDNGRVLIIDYVSRGEEIP